MVRLNPKIEGMISAAKGALCLASGIFGLLQNPQMILQGLKNMATDLISSVINSVGFVVQSRINQVLGLIPNIFAKFQLALNFNPGIQINIVAKGLDDFIMNRQECVNTAANLISCIASNAINEISNKVAMQADKAIQPITDKIANNVMKSNGVIENLVNKHDKFMQKAHKQNKLLL